MDERKIAKVFKNKTSKQKIICIPKKWNIEEGEFVEIKKLRLVEDNN